MMIAALKELVRFAPGSARQNWANVPREEMRYPKEVLLSVIERLGQRKSFLSNRDLPILDWLPAKLLDGTCARLNFSRWSLDWVSNDKVLEIVGFTPQGAQYLEWSPPSATMEPGVALTVDTSDNYAKYAKGLGTDLSISYSDLAKSTQLVERTQDSIVSAHVLVKE